MSKKKGGKKGGDEDEEKDKDIKGILENQIKLLTQEIVYEKEKIDKAKSSENELRFKMIDIEKKFQDEEENRFRIISDMKKQYNIRQEELMKENNALRKVVHDQGDAIHEKEQRIVDLKREKEYDLMQKDEEIRELKRKIEDMSSEFANMLRQTLDKMQERIELANWEADSDPQMMKRLKDIAGMNQ